MSDNQNNLRGLKYIVIFMGALIILGVIVIISTIIYRINDETIFSNNKTDINIPINIKIPEYTAINNVTSNDKTMTIHYSIDDNNLVSIFSLESGENIRNFSLNRD